MNDNTALVVAKQVAKLMGGRTYKQCRERYTNYLKEGLNVGPWTKEEDQLLLSMHAKVGNKWAEIARYLKGEHGAKTLTLILTLIVRVVGKIFCPLPQRLAQR